MTWKKIRPATLVLLLIWVGAEEAAGRGTHPGNFGIPIPGRWHGEFSFVFATGLRWHEECTSQATDPNPFDPFDPLVPVVVPSGEQASDIVGGYSVKLCRFFNPAELCEALSGPDPQFSLPWNVVVGDWDGDGKETPAVYDSAICDLIPIEEADPKVTILPGEDTWRFLPGDWYGGRVDMLAIARPQDLGDGAPSFLLSGNFSGEGDSFGVFDPDVGFTALPVGGNLGLQDRSGLPTKAPDPAGCFDFAVECWDVVVPEARDSFEICHRRTCCAQASCTDYLTRK